MRRIGRRTYIGYYLPAFYLITAFIVCFWGFQFFPLLGLPLIILITCVSLKQIPMKLVVPDFAVLTILLYEFLSFFFFSVNESASFSYLKQLSFSVLVYFLVRLYFDKDRKIILFLSSVSYYFIFLSSLGVISFYVYVNALESLEFSKIIHFKNLFHPLGFLCNDWATLLLCFAGVLILTVTYLKSRKIQWYIIMGLFPVVFGIITSFSRGMYIAMSVALIMAALVLLRQKTGLRHKAFIFTAVFIVMAIIILPFLEEVKTTASLTTTVSQVRSLESRINFMKTGYEIFTRHPLWGIGSGNFSYVASDIFENDNAMFTSRVTNSFVQLICEKGIFGFTLWFVSGALISGHFIRKKEKSASSIVIIIFLFVFSIREMTFSSFFEHPYIQLIIFTLIAIFINTIKPAAVSCDKLKPFFLLLLAGSFVFLSAKSIQKYRAEKYNKAVFLVSDPGVMLKRIQKARHICPGETGYKINESLICWKLYLSTRNHSYLKEAGKLLNEIKFPDSPDRHLVHNLAWIHYYDGDTISFFTALRCLTDKFPEVSLYNISLGQALWENKDHEKATEYFKKAILSSPNLLDSPFWANFCIEDSLRASVVKNQMLKSIGFTRVYDPIVLAKYGKILVSFGKIKEAKQCLEKSVKSLPNINRTWLNLALIALMERDTSDFVLNMKRSLLLDGSDYLPPFHLAKFYQSTGDEKKSMYFLKRAQTNYKDLCSRHYAKSLNWYDCESFKNDIIPDSLLFSVNQKINMPDQFYSQNPQ